MNLRSIPLHQCICEWSIKDYRQCRSIKIAELANFRRLCPALVEGFVWGPPAVRGSPQQQRKVYCSIGESPCGASRPGDMLHITNLDTIGNYFTYRMSASVVDTKIELMFPASELDPLILKLNVTLKLYVAQPEISVESCPRPRWYADF